MKMPCTAALTAQPLWYHAQQHNCLTWDWDWDWQLKSTQLDQQKRTVASEYHHFTHVKISVLMGWRLSYLKGSYSDDENGKTMTAKIREKSTQRDAQERTKDINWQTARPSAGQAVISATKRDWPMQYSPRDLSFCWSYIITTSVTCQRHTLTALFTNNNNSQINRAPYLPFCHELLSH